jgi:hypothetical protein
MIPYINNIINNTEIFHERPPSIFIDSLKSNGDIVALCICIAHFDGTIQRLVIESSDKCISLLAPLIAMANGKRLH